MTGRALVHWCFFMHRPLPLNICIPVYNHLHHFFEKHGSQMYWVHLNYVLVQAIHLTVMF